jgi:beta-phosphoglucomutase-like phosphatase (HAD superfamily)
MTAPLAIDPASIEALLCDADGCLFPSEEPAFVASAEVVNELMAAIGSPARFEAEELRLATTGRNFRATAAALAAEAGRTLDETTLERWVAIERERVTAHLARELRPDVGVIAPLARLGATRELAVVSSSAIRRVDACLEASGLAGMFPVRARFSAEDSLPVPTSKPDPAVYVLARERLGLGPGRGLAIEDSVPGAQAAVVAGFPTVGNVAFVPPAERAARTAALERAGVAAVVSSWAELERLLGTERGEPAPAGEASARR